MPLDGARADEQLGTDLGVGLPVARELRDLRLLTRELVARLDAARTHRLAGGHEFAAGALRQRLHTDGGKHVVGRAKFLPRVDSSALTAQPFAVYEMRARELRAKLRPAEPIERLAIQLLGGRAVSQQRPAAGLDAEREVIAAGDRRLLEPLECTACELIVTGARGRLDELRARIGPIGR